jgi:hypothetical protein
VKGDFHEGSSFNQRSFFMTKTAVLGFLLALTLAANASASTRQSVEIGKIDVQAFTQTSCLKYVDDNDYDGDCAEFRSTCTFELTMPNKNALGKAEIYKVYDLPFLGLTAPDNSDCDRDAAQWKEQNSAHVLNYTVDQNITAETMWLSPSAIGIPLRNQNSYNPRTCYRVQTLKGTAHFDGYAQALPMDGGSDDDYDDASLNDNVTISTELPDSSCQFIKTF